MKEYQGGCRSSASSLSTFKWILATAVNIGYREGSEKAQYGSKQEEKQEEVQRIRGKPKEAQEMPREAQRCQEKPREAKDSPYCTV